jgi:hypothetical protein
MVDEALELVIVEPPADATESFIPSSQSDAQAEP